MDIIEKIAILKYPGNLNLGNEFNVLFNNFIKLKKNETYKYLDLEKIQYEKIRFKSLLSNTILKLFIITSSTPVLLNIVDII